MKPDDVSQKDWDAGRGLAYAISMLSINGVALAIARAIAAEREACAQVAGECWVQDSHWRRDIAAAIRARSAS